MCMMRKCVCMMGKCVWEGGRYVCLEKRSGVSVVCLGCVVVRVDIFGR